MELSQSTLHRHKYILLVEDETAISEVQYKLFSQPLCNHKIDLAQNGQVAIDLFDRNAYDVVSLDYFLPGKINGMDVYHHIREKNKRIPICLFQEILNF